MIPGVASRSNASSVHSMMHKKKKTRPALSLLQRRVGTMGRCGCCTTGWMETVHDAQVLGLLFASLSDNSRDISEVSASDRPGYLASASSSWFRLRKATVTSVLVFSPLYRLIVHRHHSSHQSSSIVFKIVGSWWMSGKLRQGLWPLSGRRHLGECPRSSASHS